jgi:hypothetical protein
MHVSMQQESSSLSFPRVFSFFSKLSAEDIDEQIFLFFNPAKRKQLSAFSERDTFLEPEKVCKEQKSASNGFLCNGNRWRNF